MEEVEEEEAAGAGAGTNLMYWHDYKSSFDCQLFECLRPFERMFLLCVCVLCEDLVIDFGSYFSKTAVLGKNEVVMNYETKRLTPTFVGLRIKNFEATSPGNVTDSEAKRMEPVFGNRVLSLMESRPWAGTGFLPLFIDMSNSYIEKTTEALFVNKAAAKVHLRDLLRVFFKEYIECMEIGANVKVNRVGIVVPASFTLQQRRELQACIKDVGKRWSGTTDDADAVAYHYAYHKLGNANQTVLFIDVGATSVKAFCVKFELDSEQKTVVFDRLSYYIEWDQGGAFLTAKLAELIQRKIGKNSYSDVERRIIFNAAERIKCKLSIMPNVTEVLEIGDDEIAVDVRKEEVSELAVELAETVANVIAKAREGQKIDAVEVIGGSSRVTSVADVISRCAGDISVGHSLNADEAIVVGASLARGTAGGHIKSVRPRPPPAYYTLNLQLGDHDPYEMCHKNMVCKSEFSVSNATGQELKLIYDPSELRSEQVTSTFVYKLREPVPTNHTVTVKMEMSPIRISATKSSVGTKPSPLALDIPPVHSASPVYHIIAKQSDRRKRVHILKNELEKLANRVNDEMLSNITVQAAAGVTDGGELLNLVQETREWIFELEDDDDETVKALAQRHAKLKSAIDRVYARITKRKAFDDSIRLLTMTLSYVESQLKGGILDDFNESYVSDYLDKVNSTRRWFEDVLELAANTPLNESLSVTPQEVTRKNLDLLQLTRKLAQDRPSIISKAGSAIRKGVQKLLGLFGRRGPTQENKTEL